MISIKIAIRATCFLLIILLISCKETKEIKDAPAPEYVKMVSEFPLKDYVLTYASDKYQIEPIFFKEATIENTDLLRKIVHYTNYKNKIEGGSPLKGCYNELGYMFEANVGGNCDFMSTTLFDVYREFGFKVKLYDVIDGSLKGFLKYRDSHVFVEVYIPSLEKYIVQDPTINNSVFSCENLERLSFEELRKSLYIDNLQPCYLDNKISVHMSPNEKLSLRQKTGVIEDYYTGSILSVRKYDGVAEVQFKLHDLGIVTNEEKRASDLNGFKKLCNTCKFDEDILKENNKIQDFMKCLNEKVLSQGVVTSSFNGKEKGFLVQFTNEKGQNVLYDPLDNFYINKSYFSYAYWDLNNRGFLLERDFKYMVPQKFYSYRTNEVFEF